MNAKAGRVLILCPYPRGMAGGQRFGFEQYLEALAGAGIGADIQSFWDEGTFKVLYKPGHFLRKAAGVARGFARRLWAVITVFRYDSVYIYLEAAPIGPPVFEFLLFALRRRVIYAFVDSIFIPRTSKVNRIVAPFRWRSKIAYIVRNSREVIVCNRFLSDWAAQFNKNISVIPDTVSTLDYKPSERQKFSGPRPVIGWIGSRSTAPYLEIVRGALRELQDKHPFEFRVICDCDPKFDELRNYLFIHFDRNTEVEAINAFDIGLQPIPDDAWGSGKIGFKAIQYAALEIPSVVSSAACGAEVVKNGETGYVVGNTTGAWRDAMENLLTNPEQAIRFGKAARAHIIENYSVESQKEKYIRLLGGRLEAVGA